MGGGEIVRTGSMWSKDSTQLAQEELWSKRRNRILEFEEFGGQGRGARRSKGLFELWFGISLGRDLKEDAVILRSLLGERDQRGPGGEKGKKCKPNWKRRNVAS